MGGSGGGKNWVLLWWAGSCSVQLLSHVQFFLTPWTAVRQASLSITNSWSLLKLMSMESVMPSNHLILCCPLLLLPSIFPSIRVFSNEFALHIRWPKYWSFSFSISPPNEYSGLISFRMNWLDLLAIQRTLKSLLQHHSSKASILQRSAFFIVQPSHPYMTTGKTKALTRRTSVGKVMSLLFNKLSRLVITFLPWSKRLLISWLQSPSAVILEPKKRSLSWFPLFLHLFAMKWWDQMPRSLFLECWVLTFTLTFLLSSFTFTKRLFSSSSLSAIRVVSSVYLSLLSRSSLLLLFSSLWITYLAGMGFDFTVIVPFLLSRCSFSCVFGCGVYFLVGSRVLLLMVAQHLVEILVLL